MEEIIAGNIVKIEARFYENGNPIAPTEAEISIYFQGAIVLEKQLMVKNGDRFNYSFDTSGAIAGHYNYRIQSKGGIQSASVGCFCVEESDIPAKHWVRSDQLPSSNNEGNKPLYAEARQIPPTKANEKITVVSQNLKEIFDISYKFEESAIGLVRVNLEAINSNSVELEFSVDLNSSTVIMVGTL